MEQVYFYNPSGVSLFSVYVSDESYRYKEIMSDNKLYLEFELDYYIDIPSGSYVDYSGERYFAWDSAVVTKINTKNFSYKLEMNTYQQLLSWNIFRFFTWDINGIIDQKTIKTEGSYSGTLTDIANLIVRNMNDVDSNWVVGTVISSESKLISFNNEKIIDVLINVCSEENFNTEFEVKSYYDINQGKRFKQLNIGKVTYSENSPIALSYGQGNGIISGLERSNGDSTKLKRLYFQGGDRNIDPSKYGQSTLHLPKSTPYEYNGVMYMTDSEGEYVQRQFNTTKYPSDSYSNEDIYPSRVGTVTSVITIDDSKGLYNIVDTNIPSDLNYNNYFISGETPTIIFQSGVLGSQEFDISNYNHTTKTFEIVPKEDGGVTIPKGTLIPSVGNSYAIFNISLPQSYIDTAEYNALADAVKTLAKNEADNYNFKLSLDEIYAKNNWLNIGSKLNIGYWVNFSDPQFQTSTVKIRINSVKSYINNEYKFELGLTNTASASTVKNELLNINRNEVKIKDSKYNSIEYAKRRWADAIRLNQSLYDPTGDFYTEMIKPLSVQTLQMLVGDQSLQFEFVTSDFSTTIEPAFLYNKSGINSGKVTIDACSLRHLTLGISTIPTSRTITDYKHWNIPSYISATLDSSKSYYVYVKCSKAGALNGSNVWVGTSAEFILSEVPIKLEDVANYYHLWYGFLSAEYDLDRSFRTMYGYTEILPGQVTANKYISSDGNCFIDFPNNAFKFASQGDSSGIDYNVTNPNQLTVKGTIVQSPSGSSFPIACFRGAFVYGVNYYKGDEVTYNGSSYICTVNNVNIYPTDNGYWNLSSSKGDSGAALTYKGNWDNTKEYYGSSLVVQVVYYGTDSKYYISRSDAGVIPANTSPTNTTYWNVFGASFESVATGLLLAQSAYIENLIVNQLSTSANPNSERLANVGTGIGIFNNLSEQSNISNAIVAMGKDISTAHLKGGKRPALVVFDAQWKGDYSASKIYYKDDRVSYNGYTYLFIKQWSELETPTPDHLPTDTSYWSNINTDELGGGGGVSEVSSEGIYCNGSNLRVFPAGSGLNGNTSAMCEVKKRLTDTSAISSGIVGLDLLYRNITVWNSISVYTPYSVVRYGSALWECKITHTNITPSENSYWTAYVTSETYGGYFNRLRVKGLYKAVRTVTSSGLIYPEDCTIHCDITSNITLTLPIANNSMIGMEIKIRVLGPKEVTINTASSDIYIWHYRAVNLVSISNDDSMSFIWDGNYWVTYYTNQ